MNHRIPVLLDGDPGHDDAIAWMLAATGLDIRGVSSAAGNQTIEKTTRNALRICTLLGIRAPVAMGLAVPAAGCPPFFPPRSEPLLKGHSAPPFVPAATRTVDMGTSPCVSDP